MKKIKNSRGELTTQQIVLLIILIASFSIILFFFFKLNSGEETQKTICHNSVILKGSVVSSLRGGNLDCKTNYLCISGGGECEGIDPTETVEIDLNKNTAKNETMKAIADEMADCWWMFGEGKIDYVGGINVVGNNACSICSIVAFDNGISGEKISYKDFYEYLKNTKKGTSDTYLSYLYNTFELGVFTEDYLKEEFDFSKEYFVLTALGEEGFFPKSFDFLFVDYQPIVQIFKYFDEDGKEKKLENLPVIILERKKENYDKLGCDEFLTKP